MVDKTNQSVWLAAALILVVMIASISIGVGNINKKIEAKQTVNVPSAQEIASLVVIPEVVIPEFKVPEYEVPVFESDNKVDDLWKDLYSAEIDELEAAAEDEATWELEDDDWELLFDFLEANIEGFDKLKNVEVEDVEVSVLELGLEEDEDKVAEVVFELEIRYTLEEGVVQRYKEDVIATANVVFEEGDFDDEEVEFVFAF